jgi:N-acetylneuraminic acid mutarotase
MATIHEEEFYDVDINQNSDEYDNNSEEISIKEDANEEIKAFDEEQQLKENDQFLIEARLFHEQFEEKFNFKYMLLFDKSKDHSKVYYLLINPLDNQSLLSKPFEFSYPPIRDLLYYRAISVGKKVYTIGGIDTKAFNVTAQTYSYDVDLNEWNKCALMNVARCKFGVSVINGRIYVTGGQDINGNSLSSIEMYDPELNIWTSMGNLKAGIKFLSSCVLDDRYLILTGGYQMKNDNFIVYDTFSSDWKTPLIVDNLPCERENHTSIVLNGKLYLIGGIRYYNKPGDDEIEPQNENSIHSIDLKSYLSVLKNTWKTSSNPSNEYDRSGCAVCSLNNNLFIIGGHTVENFDNRVSYETKLIERLNTRTNKLETVLKFDSDVTCFDCDCFFIDINPVRNRNFKINALLIENYHFW